jgi:alkylation response protein AidB-like acyl-CoA dehydrogenase
MTATDLAWQKIRRLKALVIANRNECDRLRRLPDALAEAYLAADLYRLQIPKDFGGLELDPLTLFDLIVEVSSYDGSAGWHFGIATSGGTVLGALPLKRMAEIFSDPDCLIAASGAPPGRAVAVEGGYLLSGRWGWASGIHHARWVAGMAAVIDGASPRIDEGGKPIIRFFLLPKEKATVLDTWFTGGLRGTGSTDWEARELFVPESDAYEPFTGKTAHSAPIFRVPSVYFGMTLTAVALGIARGAIESLKDLAMQDGSLLGDQGYAHYAVAKAEALYESSHLNVRESFRAIWENVLALRPHSLAERTRVRRSYVHAVESSIEAVTLCVAAAGGAGVFDPLQRALRDVHAVNAHKVVSRRYMEIAGKAELGLAVVDPLL